MVADGVELDPGEASGSQGGGKLGLKFCMLEPGCFFRRNLNQGFFAKVADTNDAEAVTADGFLGLFDGREPIRSDGKPGGEPGREAR